MIEQPHFARRAIIMAAGKGERMRPVTDHIPKPLVPVHGVPMIETILSALQENGIDEIYVVVGYRKEQFRDLARRHPNLTLIENPDWDRANNISSLYYAREHLGDCVILDGDQIILDPDILSPAFSRSCYCCCWTDVPTHEWLLELTDGMVTGCSREGGDRGWALHSVSFWTEADGLRLREHLEHAYREQRNRQLYWDDVALFCHPEAYALGIRPIRSDALLEIDDLQELAEVDSHYSNI